MNSGKSCEPYDDLERMSLEEREKYYDEKVAWVVDYAYHHVPAMKARLSKAGAVPNTIKGVKDLERIPPITKSELAQAQKVDPPYGGFLAISPEEQQFIHLGPGGNYEVSPLTEAVARTLHGIGFRKRDIVVNTFNQNLFWGGMAHTLAFNRLGVTVIPAGPGNSELLLRVFREIKVTGYFGTGNFLLSLMRRAKEIGLDPSQDFSLRLAGHSGEMLAASGKRELKEDYGIETSETYGHEDLGQVAYECSYGCGMHICEEFFVEIVDPATGKRMKPGEVGEIVVTCLANKVYPLIRFATGDLSCLIDEPCLCGRTSPRLSRIMGRVGDVTKARGMFIYPNDLKEVASGFPEISNIQLLIDQKEYKDRLSLNVEAETKGIATDKLTEALQKAIKEKCNVRVDEVNYLTPGAIPKGSKVVLDRRTWK